MNKRYGKIWFGAVAAVAMGAFALLAPVSSAGDEHKHAMVGKQAPDFTLVDTEGDSHTLSEYTEQGKIVVLEWFNPKCPYVVKHHQRFDTMLSTHAEFKNKDVVWLAINSGREGHPTTGVDLNSEYKNKWNMDYPVLLDTKGAVGHMYAAKTTPHMYIIDSEGVLRYNGAIDDNRSAMKKGDVNYVAQALGQIIAGETVSAAETRPYGCSVKY